MQGRRTALLALVLTTPCFAHHGVAPHYDASKSVHLEGVVAKFDFINPHSFVYIDVVDAAGNTQTWSCEMASRSVLSRNGLTAERFDARREDHDRRRCGSAQSDRLPGAHGARSPTAARCETRRCTPRRTLRLPTFLPTVNRSSASGR